MFDELEEQRQETAKKNTKALKDKIIDYQRTFGDEAGERVFEDMQRAFNSQPSYEPGVGSKHMCYLEGQKSVINYIFELLRINPEELDKYDEQQRTD